MTGTLPAAARAAGGRLWKDRATGGCDNLHAAHLAEDEQVRRQLNQAVFEAIYVTRDGVTES
ncbi:MAG TPA: hypothetical protein VFV09_13585 [Actinomycetota bacterium]|jgi:hypothetical protein|nr:hypothetical protein [Actinomycetota bacterium]